MRRGHHSRTGQPAVERSLVAAPRKPAQWLRPTFLVERGFMYDGHRKHQLTPVYIAVLAADADTGTATYEVLGCPASPATVSLESLRTMLEQRGTKQ